MMMRPAVMRMMMRPAVMRMAPAWISSPKMPVSPNRTAVMWMAVVAWREFMLV
jgi:hypothetical protein